MSFALILFPDSLYKYPGNYIHYVRLFSLQLSWWMLHLRTRGSINMIPQVTLPYHTYMILQVQWVKSYFGVSLSKHKLIFFSMHVMVCLFVKILILAFEIKLYKCKNEAQKVKSIFFHFEIFFFITKQCYVLFILKAIGLNMLVLKVRVKLWVID